MIFGSISSVWKCCGDIFTYVTIVPEMKTVGSCCEKKIPPRMVKIHIPEIAANALFWIMSENVLQVGKSCL